MPALKPFKDVVSEETSWMATSDDPWFEIGTDIPPKGGWLELAWHASLCGPVCRPLLTFETASGAFQTAEAYSLLAGAPLGAQDAIVFVPPGTRRLLLSPQDQSGPFAFRLVTARWLSGPDAFMRALSRRPFVAIHALGAALIGRPFDFRLLLMEALNATPVAGYATWRQRKARAPEWSGFDALPTRPVTRLRILAKTGDVWDAPPLDLPVSGLIEVRALPDSPIWEDGSGVEVLRDACDGLADDDLLLVLPARARLLAAAVPALLAAATASPDAAFLYGDEEQPDGGGPPLRFFSGFDPLWTCSALSTAGAVGLRAGLIRNLDRYLEGERPLSAVPIHRPLLRWPGTPGAVRAIATLMERLGSHGCKVTDGPVAGPPDVAIIIPTRDRLSLLKACLDSMEPTLPPAAEVIIVDNGSVEAETITFLEEVSQRPGRHVVPVDGPFNFSHLCNAGAALTSKQMLVFLNNDTTVLANDWLTELWNNAMRPDTGAVGARLLYPSGRVQHSGVIIGIGGFAGHIDLNSPANSTGAFGRAHADHSLLAVTGACLAVEKRKFDQVGGFDDVHLPVELNDIDLCLRLHEAGYRNMLSARAELVHHESASRGRGGPATRYLGEKAYFINRWKHLRRRDPFWHPMLSMLSNKASLG